MKHKETPMTKNYFGQNRPAFDINDQNTLKNRKWMLLKLKTSKSFLEGLEKPGEERFQRIFVNQVEKAKNSIFDAMNKVVCSSIDHNYLANRYFHSNKSITKENCLVWLCGLRQRVITWMNTYSLATPCWWCHSIVEQREREACPTNEPKRTPELAYWRIGGTTPFGTSPSVTRWNSDG